MTSFDAVDLADLRLVVFGEAAGGGAEAVLAVDDEGGVVRTDLGRLAQVALHGLDGGEQEHPHRHAENGQQRAHAVAGELFQREADEGGEVADHDAARVGASVRPTLLEV